MKFLSFMLFVICLTYVISAKPLPDEENSAENVAPAEEAPKSEETESEPDKIETPSKPEPKVEKVKEKVKEKAPAVAKSNNVIERLAAPSSNPAQMEIKSWGPKDYEYSFKTDNQRQAKTIHIEDKPEDKENPYDVSDTGSFSLSNNEHGYEYNVEYTAGSDGYRPKVSFSFHS
ncbi:uncharacterized protein LOC129610413 [Condylostylus longicornis]|uniref:uncharacterized protein LOC129610413 n=1 Tax=Condylostylus longicornis TaxID=2530218 RepID=UPI00244DE495|nr:uncharacterized protein LOC129610413 [Condylostylus longicornis]